MGFHLPGLRLLLKTGAMRFLRTYQYALLFLGVVVFSLVMVLHEVIADQSAHVQRREDFLLLHERGEKPGTERLYQRLIQELPALSERSLAEDLQRTAMIIDPKTPDLDNLVWKFHVSVRNELRHRSEHRLAAQADAK
jgi:hypothetical protein